MTDFRPARLATLRDALARADLDALLVSSLPNIRYLTGFSGSSALALVTPKACLLITDFRYAAQVELELSAATTVRIEPTSLWDGLWSTLTSTVGIERIGFESAHVRHRDFQRLLEQGLRRQWRPTSDVVEALRERKDAGEVAQILLAIGIAERSLASALQQIRVGQTEMQVAGTLEHHLRDEGSEDFPFPSIVASGPRSALPHARTSERRLVDGDFLLLDFGAVSGGYCSDITRTVVLGRSSAEQREIHQVVLTANALSSGALRAGISGMAADAVARDYIGSMGFGEAFGHSLGHGIGLEVHEAPRLARSAEASLPLGAVVTIEPGVYRPGWGGVRIEDDVLLANDGPRILTTFTRDLLELV